MVANQINNIPLFVFLEGEIEVNCWNIVKKRLNDEKYREVVGINNPLTFSMPSSDKNKEWHGKRIVINKLNEFNKIKLKNAIIIYVLDGEHRKLLIKKNHWDNFYSSITKYIFYYVEWNKWYKII